MGEELGGGVAADDVDLFLVYLDYFGEGFVVVVGVVAPLF